MSDKFKETIGLAVGEASVCWSELPLGVFNTESAIKIIDEVYEEHSAIVSELERKLKEQKETIDFLHNRMGEVRIERDRYKTWIKAYATSLISASLTRGTALDAAQALAEIEGTK